VDPVRIALFVVVALALGYVMAWRMGLSLDSLFAGDGSDGVSETAPRFIPVANVAALDPLLARSHGGPVARFLHDTGCPISRAAYRRMARLGGEIPLVDVSRAHALSHAVEQRIGVRHESPQVIVSRQGQAVWSASHYAITTRAVADALGFYTQWPLARLVRRPLRALVRRGRSPVRSERDAAPR
jgi:bacillithiol system protein YtxJ